MQNDAPSRRGGMTEPNEFDEFRRRVAHEERRRRILITVLDVLIVLALAAIAALALKMILNLAPPGG
jgi:type IV secretory pathway component VirB8